MLRKSVCFKTYLILLKVQCYSLLIKKKLIIIFIIELIYTFLTHQSKENNKII